MSTPQTISEYSAGGVVYRRKDGHVEIVAVQRARHNDWSLPKGHIEKGETREQAAIREVEEEAGLRTRIVAPIGEVTYFYRRNNGTLVRKSVYHFLLEALSEELGPPNWEVSEARWVPVDEAGALLTYEKDRGAVEKAQGLLRAM